MHFSEKRYHFSKPSLRLLVDGIDALIDSLLLLFQHLGISGLLQSVEDLRMNWASSQLRSLETDWNNDRITYILIVTCQ